MSHGANGGFLFSGHGVLHAFCMGFVLALGSNGVHAQAPKPDRADAMAAPMVSPPTSDQQSTSFWHRLGDFYLADWKAAPSTEPVARRALAAPLNSPPFPSADWGYGGAATIGVPDGNVYPVMTALRKESSRIKLYGWAEVSGNASTSSTTNYPLAYISTPNGVMLNQAVLNVERQPDTMQTKHFDWGFHLSGLVGTDYRYTTAKGYLSDQLLVHNNEYGFDPVWESLDLYFPVKQGLVVRFGRFPSMPGVETQLAPGNLTITRSLIFVNAPSTETGAVATLKVTKQWMVQLGLSAGHDVAPWTEDRKPSVIACLNYSTATNHDNVYACANGINDGKYAYNNVQQFDAMWGHRFNSKWNMETEGWVMYERDVPNVSSNTSPELPLETGANGAFCAPGELTCLAPEYAVINYLNHEVNSKLYVGLRCGLMNDKKGQRTGTAGKYTANTLYGTWNVGSTVMLRSEVRFDHSWDRKGYDSGMARNQFLFVVDVIYKF